MSAVRRLCRSLFDDARTAKRWFWFNSLAGSALMPRVGRSVLYRLGGLSLDSANILDHCVIAGRSPLRIGRDTFVNRFCFFDLLAPITIGRDCQLAPQVTICTATHEVGDDGSFARRPHGEAVVIGDRCWIGTRVTVLPGSEIGNDCIVAAGAVVRGRCEPGGLYGGVPARRIRELLS